MTYRSLLVPLDHGPHSAARTQTALRLATVLDCHLVGVAPTGLIEMPATTQAAAALAEYSQLAWDTLRHEAQRAARHFRDECNAAGLKSFEAAVDDAEQAASIVRHAHCSDLTVLTQADPAHADHSRAQAIVEQVLLFSARPTLIMPFGARVYTLCTNALVAWDDSREASRATLDALPLLRLAEQVHVVSWNEAGGSDKHTLNKRLDALQRWLQWQGVSAEVSVEPAPSGIGDALAARVGDLGCDLIVMGAYGHARWVERVLGGATRGLLRSMTVPVLMSH